MYLRALAAIAALFLVSCGSTQLSLPTMPGLSPHRIEIQQGNFISEEMVALLKPGMSKDQVRFILGTALIADSFHADRWDYVFRRQKANSRELEQRKLAVHFEGGKLARVESDVKPLASADVAAVKMPETNAPVAKPETPTPKPVAPVAKPEVPVAKPVEPVAKPAAPVAKPETPAPKPVQPVAKPEAPIARSVEPVAKPETPATKPVEPVAKPEAPVAKPMESVAKLAAPVAKPETPAPKFELPLLEREAPAARPEAHRQPAAAIVPEKSAPALAPPAQQPQKEKSWWERLRDRVKS